jgi:hypothetical protein
MAGTVALLTDEIDDGADVNDGAVTFGGRYWSECADGESGWPSI